MMNDSAVMIAGTGYILTDDVATATKPTLAALTTFAGDTTVPPTGWNLLGHTSLANVLAFGSDGGGTEVKGSWQNKSLRELVTSEAVDYFTINSIQILDNDVLTLYYGGGDASVANEFSLPDNPTPQERAALVVFLDGDTPVGFFASKSSIRREGPIVTPTDDFVEMPLRFTLLKKTGSPKATWIADELGATV